MPTRILVTGGCGFIGSNFVRLVMATRPDWEVVNLDKLTYAGRLENLADAAGHPGYRFVKGDICDPEAVADAMRGCRLAVNFAAETHVDRSLLGAGHFIDTDIKGVLVLLEEARRVGLERFVQISTDEVYGSIESGSFTEESVLNPRNPYSASKAGGDRLAYAYWATHRVPVIITRASNNYGPYQYPEKLIPLFVTNALRDEALPLYGDGRNVRDWLHVADHCRAILFLLKHGAPGEVYNVAGGNERENIAITHEVLRLLGKPKSLIRPVQDRPGHDRRYSLDAAKLRRLGWRPEVAFEAGLADTVRWYVEHEGWWRPVKDHDGEFRRYYEEQYGDRLK
ncbi:MAG TPA: dTDP-glucose 4,6-dehydratase [Thermoanaerobaculaceae bacterium]|nr:dTDP-glucose 4,6-dehydratase [Thermoanaerobaculaceae bacterium]